MVRVPDLSKFTAARDADNYAQVLSELSSVFRQMDREAFGEEGVKVPV